GGHAPAAVDQPLDRPHALDEALTALVAPGAVALQDLDVLERVVHRVQVHGARHRSEDRSRTGPARGGGTTSTRPSASFRSRQPPWNLPWCTRHYADLAFMPSWPVARIGAGV